MNLADIILVALLFGGMGYYFHKATVAHHKYQEYLKTLPEEEQKRIEEGEYKDMQW